MADSSDAVFKMSKVPVPTEYTKFSMDLVMRRRGNQISIIDKAYGFGHTAANNWLIYDGEGATAKLVARGQGSHINSGAWVSSYTIVFENERFKGSTLQVMGRDFGADQWAIVGGTGQFALATGVIKQKLLGQPPDGFSLQLTVEGFCPVFQGSTNMPARRDGPAVGGSGGVEFDITDAPQRLESVTIKGGDIIDSIAFSYTDKAGNKHSVGPWGGKGGELKTIVLAPGETLTKVRGTTNYFQGNVVVETLTLTTSLATYAMGKAGEFTVSEFSFPSNDGDVVVGFFGRADSFLNAIGVYTA